MKEVNVILPLTVDIIRTLRSGTPVLISGELYSARDAAHKLMYEALEKGKVLPIELANQTIYYMGPAPARPGKLCGSAGPTSSYRMDKFTPALIKNGLKGMIGKGNRNKEAIEAMRNHEAVYFTIIGGAGALISECIVENKIVAYPELGAEAIRRLIVRDMPAFVAIDCFGGNIYENYLKYQK